jgi:hypothetical protein
MNRDSFLALQGLVEPEELSVVFQPIVGMRDGHAFAYEALVRCALTFVFVEKDEEESAIELPRDRMESVTMELAVGSLRHEGSIEKRTGKGPQTVFILELDASIIVQGTASELMEVESKLKKHHYRIEEAIDETIRTSTPALLTEPDTLTIRNQIRDRINQIIEMSVVKEVVFGHYRAFHTPIKT